MRRLYKARTLSWCMTTTLRRYANGCGQGSGKNGLVLGVYEGCEPGEFTLTPSAARFDDSVEGKFKELVKGTKLRPPGKVQIFGNLGEEFYLVAAAALGHESATINPKEQLDECRENIRIASGSGAMHLQSQGVNHVFVEEFTNAEAAGEGASLGIWRYQDWKAKENQENKADVQLWGSENKDGWIRGIIKGEAQNRAREMQEAPANLMTPTIFSQFAQELLCPCGVDVIMRDRDWIEANNLHAFLTMARGSCEQPSVIEINYCGAGRDEKPIVFVGKGVTFDAGGLHLKPCRGMSMFRGDLAGAAAIVGMIRAIAQLSVPINVTALLAMYENMPSGLAIKPGDVVMARNGKTIVVEDTDNEGRIVIADLLSLVPQFSPCLTVNIATSHIGLLKSLGSPVNAVFSTSDVMYWELIRAGTISGDRVWRLPFWKYFRSRVTNYTNVDVANAGKGVGGMPCLGAAYLLEFSPPDVDFIYLDISATGLAHPGIGMPYLRRHCMSGRPVRLLTQFLYQIACPHESEPC